MKSCIIAGCAKGVSGYSTLCVNHAKTKARHGHPLQTSIRRPELKPFERAVRNWLDERAGPDAWPILLDLFGGIVSEARIYSERVGHGRPYSRFVLRAGETLVSIERDDRNRDAVVRLLALGYLRQNNPRRFQDDRAFRFQIARQLRQMTDVSVGVYWDNDSQKAKKVHRDASPKTLRALANIVMETGLTGYGEEIGRADAQRSMAGYRKRPDVVRRALLGKTVAELESGVRA
jgi:hypothetical protein